MQTLSERTLGDLVADRPNLASLFDALGLDFCCGGRSTLADACAERGLDLETVSRAVDGARSQPSAAGRDGEPVCTDIPTEALLDHIESKHHRFLRETLPTLERLAAKVAAAHGERHVEMRTIPVVLRMLSDDLLQHMAKEEQVLFPAIRAQERGEAAELHCGGLDAPIRNLELEHEEAARALRRLRHLARDFTVPADGCATWRALADGLRALEIDLHRHVHEENNVLFVRALRREAR